jgi:calcium-dependent protein kinase
MASDASFPLSFASEDLPPHPEFDEAEAETPEPPPRQKKELKPEILSFMRERLGHNLNSLTVDTREVPSNTSQPPLFNVLRAHESINDLYDFENDIYTGGLRNSNDKVVSARRRSDGQELAVKIRSKRKSGAGDGAWREIMEQLRRMLGNNEHCLEMIEIVEDESAYYVVMPKCQGGEFHQYLLMEAEIPESECKRLTREILTAVGHLHQYNIVHRDIKPENILFDIDPKTPGSAKTIKLIDWDTCVLWGGAGSPKRRSFAGTPGYIAPEVLLGDASPQSDLFSIGVVLYILMTGELPWGVDDLPDGLVGSPAACRMYRVLQDQVIDWEMDPWPHFPLARDLCQHLLAFEPGDRCSSVEEALGHPWLFEEEQMDS